MVSGVFKLQGSVAGKLQPSGIAPTTTTRLAGVREVSNHGGTLRVLFNHMPKGCITQREEQTETSEEPRS